MVDTSAIVTHDFLHHMQEVGVKTIARYYDYDGTGADPSLDETIPNKRLRPHEPQLLRDHGFRLLVVFQHNNNKPETFQDWRVRGPSDAYQCLSMAETIQQPENSTLYFGVDGDFYGDIPGYPKTQHSTEIHAYFDAIAEVLAKENAGFHLGAYGGGACINGLKDKGLIAHRWLSHSHGFVGSKAAHQSGDFEIEQYLPGKCGGREVDFNHVNPAAASIGDFAP